MTETARAPGTKSAATGYHTKLIEVALPLEAINQASAEEKLIRYEHPSTLHLWWARRPLAACRAVLFAQLVDDPSAVPEEFPTEEEREAERQRLFRIIEELVKWENSTNEAVLMAARREIARSVARTAGVPGPDTNDDVWRILREHAPPVLDPFCGGGSIPLEVQRLGLEARASDLNPVAVLITKAMIEIPPKFAGMPPVNPRDRDRGMGAAWKGAAGLAADVRYYGEWMREEAERRIGHLYPKVTLPPEQGGGEATVIAWLWARTVACPNPACRARMPLVHSFALSTKKGKETWVEPLVDREAKTVRFEVRSGKGTVPDGTKQRGQSKCLVCGTVMSDAQVREQARAFGLDQQLLAVVADSRRGRVYISPNNAVLPGVRPPNVTWLEQPLPDNPRWFSPPGYGLPTYGDLFTPRQLIALTTFSDLVAEARERVLVDARAAEASEGHALREGGESAAVYADAVTTYLGFAVDRCVDYWSSLVRWQSANQQLSNTFGRQALPMLWDFAEANPFSGKGGSAANLSAWTFQSIERLRVRPAGSVRQVDASMAAISKSPAVVSTDPPYYDNISYADLSDFFYVWLRRSLRSVYPELFRTLLVPKAEELVATPYRFDGNKRRAQNFFEQGLGKAFERMHDAEDRDYPLTVYYAFKQAESGEGDNAAASTGWETMLSGLLRAGFSISGTWPMRSELANRMIASGTNALASSIVLVCRPRPADAPLATRRELTAALRAELPKAIATLQRESIAPVDLAQASIGPGMSVFSRYARVLEADGSPMSVRTALQIINQELDRVLAEQEGEMDPDTRFCVAWFDQYGMKTAKYGEADVLARAKDTSVEGLVRAGVLEAKGGQVRLLGRDELDPDWDPRTDSRLTDWECCQHLIRALAQGEAEAAALAVRMGRDKAETARLLAYRLFTICDRRKWSEEALAYDGLAASWSGVQVKMTERPIEQGTLI